MTSLFTLVLMTLAAFGGGAALLRAAGVAGGLAPVSALAWSAMLGLGLLGWIGFFLALFGWLHPWQLGIAAGALLPGLWWLRREHSSSGPVALDGIEKTLVAVIMALLAFDLCEGLAPPADADTLAYHFATPKLFLRAGELFFIPRAGDGAVPLLQQMSYLIALGLGGEKAVTLWTMVSGWFPAALVYAIARENLDRRWALAAAALFLSAPAVIYGAGSGQVEIRNAGFALLAAAAVARARGGAFGFAIVAGLAAGFFVGSKYTGLVFAFACGAVLLTQRHWFAMGAVFSLCVVAGGGQWYAWNWYNIGDPVFPMLYGVVDYRPEVPWNGDIHRYYFETTRSADRLYPVNPLGWIAYPIVETVTPSAALESLRTGFGVFWLVALPLAAVAAFDRSWRRDMRTWLVMLAIAGISYSLWFFLGPSQRLRHLAPLLPVVLLVAVSAAAHVSRRGPVPGRAVALAAAAILTVQLGMQTLSTVKYIQWLAAGESRDAFLERNINRYPMVAWINRNLPPDSMIFDPFRETVYLLDRPVFYAHPNVQAEIDLRITNRDAAKFWRQLRAKGITHVFDGATPRTPFPDGGLPFLKKQLEDGRCLRTIKRIESPLMLSRTFGKPENAPIMVSIVAVPTPESCIYEPH